jgi:hypothetical protein
MASVVNSHQSDKRLTHASHGSSLLSPSLFTPLSSPPLPLKLLVANLATAHA